MKRWVPARRDIISFAGVFGLLGAVYLLPPDTALRDIRAAGVLRACVPQFYPPLVTADPSAPGIDVDLLSAIAARLGVRLETVTNSDIGGDFNPRAWRITRAQCAIIAGGVADSVTTRSFLDVTPPYVVTGWAWLAAHPAPDLLGKRICVFVPATGLDRLALSAWLRAAHTQTTIVENATDVVENVKQGQCDVGVTERLLAVHLAATNGLTAGWMPRDLDRYPLVFGLWKGDLTLKRAVVAGMDRLRREGEMAKIESRYLPEGSVTQEKVNE